MNQWYPPRFDNVGEGKLLEQKEKNYKVEVLMSGEG